MKKKFKIIILIILTLILLLGGGLYAFLSQVYTPSNLLYESVNSNDYIFENDCYIFNKNNHNQTGLILYPGALVEPLSYSYLAKELANEGYFVVIPKMNLNLSILETNKADAIIDAYSSIDSWYIGGHSMGGVSACSYADDHEDSVNGIFLLGSYPASSNDLSSTSLDVISIYAENDGLTTIEDINESKQLLPSSTDFIEITGGNHAQFGLYGEQKGDKEATISPLEQQNEIIQSLLNFLES